MRGREVANAALQGIIEQCLILRPFELRHNHRCLPHGLRTIFRLITSSRLVDAECIESIFGTALLQLWESCQYPDSRICCIDAAPTQPGIAFIARCRVQTQPRCQRGPILGVLHPRPCHTNIVIHFRTRTGSSIIPHQAHPDIPNCRSRRTDICSPSQLISQTHRYKIHTLEPSSQLSVNRASSHSRGDLQSCNHGFPSVLLQHHCAVPTWTSGWM